MDRPEFTLEIGGQSGYIAPHPEAELRALLRDIKNPNKPKEIPKQAIPPTAKIIPFVGEDVQESPQERVAQALRKIRDRLREPGPRGEYFQRALQDILWEYKLTTGYEFFEPGSNRAEEIEGYITTHVDAIQDASEDPLYKEAYSDALKLFILTYTADQKVESNSERSLVKILDTLEIDWLMAFDKRYRA